MLSSEAPSSPEWKNLPLKKRVVASLNAIENAARTLSLAESDSTEVASVQNDSSCDNSVKLWRAFSPPLSEYSASSFDSGFAEKWSPEALDLRNPVSVRRNSSPELMNLLSYSITISNEKGLTIKCGECDKQFYNRVRYRAHLRRHMSKNSGRYRCNTCQKTFVQRSSLNTHQRIHTGEKPFKCHFCDDSFGDFSTFTKHKRIHSGEKPYSCPVCSRSFSQSGNMHRHIKSVHEKMVLSRSQTSTCITSTF